MKYLNPEQSSTSLLQPISDLVKSLHHQPLPSSEVPPEWPSSLVFESHLKEKVEDMMSDPASGSGGKLIVITEDGQVRHSIPKEKGNPVVLSGSFNPLHEGHVKMLSSASLSLGTQSSPFFELSVHNVDKPSLPCHLILDRASQFAEIFIIY